MNHHIVKLQPLHTYTVSISPFSKSISSILQSSIPQFEHFISFLLPLEFITVLADEFAASRLGTRAVAVVEGGAEEDLQRGMTERYLRVSFAAGGFSPGALAEVQLESMPDRPGDSIRAGLIGPAVDSPR